VDTGTPFTLEDAEKPPKREPRPAKPDLKAFYPVTRPEEETRTSVDKPSRDDCSALGVRSKDLSLTDNIAPVPTPTPPQKSTQNPTPNDVIEISSDSDEGDPALPHAKPMVVPLLVARSCRRAQSQIQNDIIDLT
jgi:hypothetical protein